MTRIILSVIMIISVVASFAQLYAVGQYAEVSLSGDVNHIYLFGSIDDQTEIHYKSSNPTVYIQWFTYLNGTRTPLTSVSTTSSPSTIDTYFKPQNNT